MTSIAYDLTIGTNHARAYHDEVAALREILTQMQAELYTPDVIVGLGRGGLIAAVWASHALNVPMVPIQWSIRDFASKTPNVCNLILPYSRVLVLDELCDTGAAFIDLKTALDIVTGPDRIVKYAALFQRAGSAFVPDFIGDVVHTDEWLTFSCEHVGAILKNLD